jgi:hypothetical protein
MIAKLLEKTKVQNQRIRNYICLCSSSQDKNQKKEKYKLNYRLNDAGVRKNIKGQCCCYYQTAH